MLTQQVTASTEAPSHPRTMIAIAVAMDMDMDMSSPVNCGPPSFFNVVQVSLLGEYPDITSVN